MDHLADQKIPLNLRAKASDAALRLVNATIDVGIAVDAMSSNLASATSTDSDREEVRRATEEHSHAQRAYDSAIRAILAFKLGQL